VYISSWQGLGFSELMGRGYCHSLPFPLNIRNGPYFYLARGGIYYLFRNLLKTSNDTVLVPAYHHGNEINAIIAAGWKVCYYSIDRWMKPDLEELERLCDERTRAILVIHYLGWPQPIAEIAEFCRQRGLIFVEDCALSFLSDIDGQPLGSFGDYAIFCLYKTLPLPNGGLIVQRENARNGFVNIKLRSPEKIATIARCTELVMERIRLNTDAIGKRLFWAKSKIGDFLNIMRIERTAVGDTGFDLSKVDIEMSSICHAILRNLDYEKIRHQRRKNFLYLCNLFDGKICSVFHDLPKGVCPLFYPIFVRDKGKAATILREHCVEAVEFWNSGNPTMPVSDFPDVQFLRKHLLELPIHQDLQERQLEYLARQVLNFEELRGFSTE